jgi:hypothetical protein
LLSCCLLLFVVLCLALSVASCVCVAHHRVGVGVIVVGVIVGGGGLFSICQSCVPLAIGQQVSVEAFIGWVR